MTLLHVWTQGNQRLYKLYTLEFRESCALRATVPFWPSSCKRDVRERRCRDLSAHWIRKLSCNPAAKKPCRANHSATLAPVAILAIKGRRRYRQYTKEK